MPARMARLALARELRAHVCAALCPGVRAGDLVRLRERLRGPKQRCHEHGQEHGERDGRGEASGGCVDEQGDRRLGVVEICWLIVVVPLWRERVHGLWTKWGIRTAVPSALGTSLSSPFRTEESDHACDRPGEGRQGA